MDYAVKFIYLTHRQNVRLEIQFRLKKGRSLDAVAELHYWTILCMPCLGGVIFQLSRCCFLLYIRFKFCVAMYALLNDMYTSLKT